MPSVVYESASVNAALRESLSNSKSNLCSTTTSSNHLQRDNDNNIDNILVNSVETKSLLNKIEYEEINFRNSLLNTLKSKYVALKPTLDASGKSMIPMNGNCVEGTDHNSSLPQTNAMKTDKNGTSSGHNEIELPAPKQILFPRENIQVGWKNGNRKWHIGVGMLNVGNTCYVNSTLQALFHVPSIAHWLWSDEEHRDKCEEEFGIQDGCIICLMAKTLIMSQTSQAPIRPYMVYTKLKIICKHLIIGRQEDAHEFLRYLIESMEKAYLCRYPNRKELDQLSKETTPLNQILGGYLKSVVRCLACDHLSTTFQHFEDLLLDIRKADTIEDALDGYFTRERLEDMGYKCESCKKKVSATKQFILERAPISLCIQLKRFSVVGGKITKNITIKPRIDLSKYMSKNSSKENLTYRLVSMVTHLGPSQHCGHYTAIGLTETGTYYQFDDSFVSSISLQNVVNTNAYIIFYELDNLPYSHQNNIEMGENVENSFKISEFDGYTNPKRQKCFSLSTASSTSNTITSENSDTIEFNSAISKLVDQKLPPVLVLRNDKPHTNGENKLVNPINVCKTNENGLSLAIQSQKASNKRTTIHFKNLNGSKPPILTATQNGNNNTDDDDLIITNSPSMPLLSSPINKTNELNYEHSKKNGASLSAKIVSNDIQSRRLVPYESESEDDVIKLNETVTHHNKLNDIPQTDIPNSKFHNGTVKKNEKSVNNESHINANNCSSSIESKISKRSINTEPPTPVIKTKTGLWQVTSIPGTSNNANQSDKKKTNPFLNSTPNATTTLYNNGNVNDKKSNLNNDSIANVPVSDLNKFSHRGYGAPVLNWNGEKSEMDKEVNEDVRTAQKRENKQDEENEMDRGRTKKQKIQIHGPDYNGNDNVNPGYNAFQEHQNSQYGTRRWEIGSVNRTYHKPGYRPHPYRKKFISNYKFNPRSHYQRTFHNNKNNCGEFYGRES